MPDHRFEIAPRPAVLGGGWQLRLFQQQPDGVELEIGGGVFPPGEGISADDAYADALQTGEEWVERADC
jgi:hypothetical protein